MLVSTISKAIIKSPLTYKRNFERNDEININKHHEEKKPPVIIFKGIKTPPTPTK